MNDDTSSLQAKMDDASINITVPLCQLCKRYREFDKDFILEYGVVYYCEQEVDVAAEREKLESYAVYICPYFELDERALKTNEGLLPDHILKRLKGQ